MRSEPLMSETEITLDQRLSFARIDENVGKTLRESWRFIEPRLPVILDRFYAHLKSEPRLATLIGGNDDRLKSAQIQHWRRLFGGRFDDEYVGSVHAIGRAHHAIGLVPSWYIAGYQFILNELARVAAKRYRFSPGRFSSVLEAINKAIMFDLDIAISVYQQVLLDERRKHFEHTSNEIDTFRDVVGELIQTFNAKAEELSLTASELDTVSTSASDQASSAASASETTSETVQSVAAATEQMTASINEIARQLATATDIVRKATSMTESSSTSIKQLSESSGQIGSVVQLIQDIAEQTNLLALNATIEAARAGEAGKGFAVVAQEVKSLASQTARATDEISNQIGSVQNETATAVDTINKIAEIMRDVDGLTATIAAAVEEQEAATAEITSHVQLAANGTRQLAANVSEVDVAITSSKDAASTVNAASGELSQQSVRLTEEVEAFFRKLREGPFDRRKEADPNYSGPERRQAGFG